MAQHTPATSRAGTFGAILRVTSGNFLEQFDFFLFGFYATYIARTFFPAESEFASLMLTFAVFGSGFLMRPVGAIVLGAYIDRIGRRKGLMVTLAIMGCGTLLIALVPGYQTIGLAAPALVLLGRLLQGFSAGVELGGVSVYLSEIATPGNKGFYTSWQSASQQVAIVVAALIGYSLNITLGQFDRHHVGGGVQFYLVTHWRRDFRPDWPSRRINGHYVAGADHHLARHAMADRRARLYPHDAGTAVVLFLFWHV